MKQYIEQQEHNMLHLLQKLVNENSGSDYKAGVDRVGQMLAQQFAQLGYIVQAVEQPVTGNHLVLTHKEATTPGILVVAHLDTVFGANTATERPFSIEGERAYGPGVIDMKASHVTLLYALKALAAAGAQQVLHNIQIVFNSDEEIGSPTSRQLIEQIAAGKDCCLCMEPARANGALVSARRGGGSYTITVHGKASHAGIAPQEGANAIAEMAYKIIDLQALNDPAAGISVNVDTIHGGTATNVICDLVEVAVDVRTSKQEQGPMLEQKIKAICETVHIDGTHTEWSGGIDRPPMEKNDGTIALLERIQAVGAQLGITVQDVATGGGGDASYTSAIGIPTIDGLGPVGGFAHSDKEYLEIPSLKERTLLLANVMESLTVQKLQQRKLYV